MSNPTDRIKERSDLIIERDAARADAEVWHAMAAELADELRDIQNSSLLDELPAYRVSAQDRLDSFDALAAREVKR